ncbi:class I SAM-dependent methyltransferase [Methylorubrum aminovorans]
MRHGSLTLDAFLANRAADRRLARLTHDMSLPQARGLEFGPGNNPVSLPEGVSVSYVDYALDASKKLPGAAPIDHAWTGAGSLSDLLEPEPYDFAIAAHVMQYVPNLLGWLRGIHGVLRAGGVLNLSLPDKRFMFDAARPVSTLAELVEADLLDFTRPSPRQLFAHASEVRTIAPAEIWNGADPAAAARMSGEDAMSHAYREASAALAAGLYVPCHCWVFTPESFLGLVAGATQLGLFPFVLNRIGVTEVGGFEFYVSMRRDAEVEPSVLRGLQDGAIVHLSRILAQQQRTAALVAKR